MNCSTVLSILVCKAANTALEPEFSLKHCFSHRKVGAPAGNEGCALSWMVQWKKLQDTDEIKKKLGRCGVCREGKTKTEESRRIRKIVHWGPGEGRDTGRMSSISRVGVVGDESKTKSAQPQQVALDMLPCCGCDQESVCSETAPLLKQPCPDSSMGQILLQSQSCFTRSSRIQDIHTMSTEKAFPWFLAHRWDAWNLLGLFQAPQKLGFYPYPSWHWQSSASGWPYQWLRYSNKFMLTGKEPPPCHSVALLGLVGMMPGAAGGLQDFLQQPYILFGWCPFDTDCSIFLIFPCLLVIVNPLP